MRAAWGPTKRDCRLALNEAARDLSSALVHFISVRRPSGRPTTSTALVRQQAVALAQLMRCDVRAMLLREPPILRALRQSQRPAQVVEDAS